VGQHQVLFVADPDLAGAVAFGQRGDAVHLLGGGVARGTPVFLRDRVTMAWPAARWGLTLRATQREKAGSWAGSVGPVGGGRRGVVAGEEGFHAAEGLVAEGGRAAAAPRPFVLDLRAKPSRVRSFTRILMRALYLLSRRPWRL
jgi:hypothetical protein